MKDVWIRLMKDDRGLIISAELVLILTIGVLAMIVGLHAVAKSVNQEFNDISGAIGSLNQSYVYRGLTKWGHASVAGSGFIDRGDFCDCSAIIEVTPSVHVGSGVSVSEGNVGGGAYLAPGAYGAAGAAAGASASAAASASASAAAAAAAAAAAGAAAGAGPGFVPAPGFVPGPGMAPGEVPAPGPGYGPALGNPCPTGDCPPAPCSDCLPAPGPVTPQPDDLSGATAPKPEVKDHGHRDGKKPAAPKKKDGK